MDIPVNATPAKAAMPVHCAMNQFQVQDGDLVIGGERLTQLVGRLGQTPFYAYDRSLMAQRVAELRAVLPVGLKLHYAMKANPLPQLVKFMVGLVDGIDIASAGELKVAMAAHANPLEVSFAGPGKREAELLAAVNAGVLINLESFREVTALEAICASTGLTARVALRVNPDFELKGSGMRMGGGAKPFGVDVEQIPQMLKAVAHAGLGFEGFHIFAGSQSLQANAICEAQQKSFELALQLSALAPAPVRSINLGGGLGVPYYPGEKRLELALIGENLHLLAQRAEAELPGAALVLELGRYLVAEAGVYVTRVLDRKLSRGQVFLVTDGGLNHHLSASGNFGQVVRKNYPVAIGNRMDSRSKEIASVVGPLCTPLDLLADRMDLPVAQAGDLFVVFQSGAYGASASPQGFLGHPACLEVLV